ncbi:hypothetical protein ACDW_01360 [Acidovorax sp. DW039]|uniref:hypothetical protein n=1 Tax=Acidovorax sp. DW039 TaxID=3095606 RepID=UPI00308F2373|nr:hypothetical protein ACDW_01360 [Acidovorax sp. DW039]
MALDMYAHGEREAIGHHEEFIFSLAQADAKRFPHLLSLWGAFYDDPRIPPAQAEGLVHELIDLLALHGGLANKALASPVIRLLPFFSRASRGGWDITTQSD